MSEVRRWVWYGLWIARTSETPVGQGVSICLHASSSSRAGAILLGQGLALPLEQAVSLLSSLELGLHYTQRLPGRKDRLSILF